MIYPMKTILFFSLLFILSSCAVTHNQGEEPSMSMAKHHHTCHMILRYPDAAIVGGASLELSEQLSLYYASKSDDSMLCSPISTRVSFRTDSLTGETIGFIPSDILFGFDEYKLTPSQHAPIDFAVSYIKQNSKDQVIQIVGHTDSIGTDEYNLLLSQRRATSVGDYIQSHYGGEVTVAEIIGIGEAQPTASNDTAENRQKNRRVEIIFKAR